MAYVNDVTFPRSVAMQLAQFERDSLRARGRDSRRCRQIWYRGADQANLVMELLRARRDAAAGRAALWIGPTWKQAADCEGWTTPRALGQEAAEAPTPFSVEQTLKAHSAALARIKKSSEEQLLFRRIATVATVAGALFAMIRLTDIYFAVKARRKGQ